MKYPKKYTKRSLIDFEPIETREGENIETKVRRLTEDKSPINDGAPIIYTERKDGVLPAYDIRADRFEIAQEAMQKHISAVSAKRKQEYDLLLNGDKKDAESGNKEVTENSGAA